MNLLQVTIAELETTNEANNQTISNLKSEIQEKKSHLQVFEEQSRKI